MKIIKPDVQFITPIDGAVAARARWQTARVPCQI